MAIIDPDYPPFLTIPEKKPMHNPHKILFGQRISFNYDGNGYSGFFTETVKEVLRQGRENQPYAIRTHATNRMKADFFRYDKMTDLRIGMWNKGNLIEQIEQARALVGKNVAFYSGVAKASGIRVLTNWKEIPGAFWEDFTFEDFQANGNCVVTVYSNPKTENTYDRINAVQFLVEAKDNEWDKIVIKGYKAERIEHLKVWKFGCAKIPFHTVQAAHLLCNSHIANGEYRGVEGVMLGQGLFEKHEIAIMAKHSN